ncbi:MAG: DsbA family oxidoreductase [Pseudomonadota bacterium]
MIPLDIISDPICPWCYIGKANLDRAIEETGKNPFSTTWRIFQLNPDMPAQGVDRKEYLEWKFGGPEGAKQVYGRIAQAGKAAGLDMKLEAIPRTPNTFDAHRLIRWAKVTGNQTALVNQLFRKYFEQGVDISERDVLLEAAESIGLEREVVDELLNGDADRDKLIEEEGAARQMGVTGVPCFIINGKHVVQGAQDTATWVKIIEELSEALDNHQEATP